MNQEIFREGAIKSLRNAQVWLDETDLLFTKESYGHACALAIHGLEAFIYSYSCWLVYIGALSQNDKSFQNVFKRDEDKFESNLGFFLGKLIFEKDLGIFDVDLEQVVKEFEYFRQKSIYMSFQNNEFSSPFDITKMEAENLINLVNFVKERVSRFVLDSDEETQIAVKEILTFMNEASV
jgi:AbiV family abortive infection protein